MSMRITQPLRGATSEPLFPRAGDLAHRFNIASYLPRMAETVPDQAAVVVQHRRGWCGGNGGRGSGRFAYASVSFRELESLSNRYAHALGHAGFERGMRTLLMVRPGIEFTALVFAMFRLGLVPVMIDPGMGVNRMLECIRTVELQGFIGIPVAHVMRVLRRRAFRSVKKFATVGHRWFWGGPTLSNLTRRTADRSVMADTGAADTAAILFTSGSTGPAKGVVYEHGMFDAQVRAIRTHYGIEPGEVDLATFPLFALFDTAMGMTCVVPEMDASHPARVRPENIVAAIFDQKVTSTFGSPALWRRVAEYGVNRGVRFDSLRRVLIAGAPVPYRTIEQLQQMLPDGADVHTPYGATESLPVSSIAGREILADCREKTRQGAGTCVGKPLPEATVRIIRIMDEPIAQWSDDLLVPDGETGEIVVSGPSVTKTYFNLPEADEISKIGEGDRVWHRIGDVGYRDDEGRLWFCGRKSHRVETAAGALFTEPCEAIFNEHPDVSRSALVGVGPRGSQRPVMIVELRDGRVPIRAEAARLRLKLLSVAAQDEITSSIRDVYFHRSLPVDVRHNAKINRELLADWAARRLA